MFVCVYTQSHTHTLEYILWYMDMSLVFIRLIWDHYGITIGCALWLFHWTETRLQLSDCVNEQYSGLRAIYVCNRHGWMRAVGEYNSTSVCGSLLWIPTEHRLRTAGFKLLYFIKFLKSCINVYCSVLTMFFFDISFCLKSRLLFSLIHYLSQENYFWLRQKVIHEIELQKKHEYI